MIKSLPGFVQFAEFIRDGYERSDINHVDYRVGAYKAALDVLEKAPSVTRHEHQAATDGGGK